MPTTTPTTTAATSAAAATRTPARARRTSSSPAGVEGPKVGGHRHPGVLPRRPCLRHRCGHHQAPGDIPTFMTKGLESLLAILVLFITSGFAQWALMVPVVAPMGYEV